MQNITKWIVSLEYNFYIRIFLLYLQYMIFSFYTKYVIKYIHFHTKYEFFQ